MLAAAYATRPWLARAHILLTYTLHAAMQGMTWAVPGAVANTYTSLCALES